MQERLQKAKHTHVRVEDQYATHTGHKVNFPCYRKLQRHSYCGSKRVPASSNANTRLASQLGRSVRMSRAGSLISETTLIGDQLGFKRHVPYGFCKGLAVIPMKYNSKLGQTDRTFEIASLVIQILLRYVRMYVQVYVYCHSKKSKYSFIFVKM